MVLGRTLSAPELGAELAASARRFLRQRNAGAQAAAPRSDGDTDDGWREIGEQGWFRILVSTERGGIGLTIVELGQVLFCTGAALVGGPVLDHAVALAMLRNEIVGNAELLEAGLDGSIRVVLADPAAEPLAHLGADRPPAIHGDRVVGTVPVVAGAGLADAFIVVARSPVGPHIVVLEAADPGVEVERLETADATTVYGSVTLDAPLGASGSVLTGHDAAAYLRALRPALLTAASCELSGLAEALGDMAVAYARQRTQFSKPIGAFQAVQHILADISVGATSLRNLCLSGLSTLAETPTDWITAAGLKSYASRTAQRIAEQSLQVHGGIGFTESLPLHRYLKRVLALVGAYGDERWLNAAIGRALLDGGTAPEPWSGRHTGDASSSQNSA
jgi:alkylation response protein AidB-like acyl-CoA dehydrogenase